MEKQVDYSLLLPLEKMVFSKIAIALWNKTNILAHFAVGSDSERNQSSPAELEEGIKDVTNNMSELNLPSKLFKQFKPVIEWVGEQIQDWGNFHIKFLSELHTDFERSIFMDLDVNIGTRILESLYWTPSGTVNYRRTAEELIRQEMLDFFSLYRLATLYCLEDYIPVLWTKLPLEIHTQFPLYNGIFYGWQSHLDAFWFKLLCEENSEVRGMPGPINILPHAFKKSALTANKAAMEYFFQKMTPEDRRALVWSLGKEVVRIREDYLGGESIDLPLDNFSDVLSYLLSQMTPKEQMNLFEAFPIGVLRCFIEWSWHDLFFKIAEHIWDFLSLENYYDLLGIISNDMFQDFFLCTPANLQELFLDCECLDGRYLSNNYSEDKDFDSSEYFDSDDFEIITFVYKNVDNAAKVRLSYCDQMLEIYRYLIRHDEWQLLKTFIPEVTTSKEERVRLKDTIKPFLEMYERRELERKILEWEQLFLSFDQSDCHAAVNTS